jgi:hypothetical protein
LNLKIFQIFFEIIELNIKKLNEIIFKIFLNDNYDENFIAKFSFNKNNLVNEKFFIILNKKLITSFFHFYKKNNYKKILLLFSKILEFKFENKTFYDIMF